MGYFIVFLVLAIIVAMIAGSKGRNWFGWFLYGLLIWPIALVHALLLKDNQPPPARQNTTANPTSASPPDTCKKCGHVQYGHLRICKNCRYDKESDPDGLYTDERDCPMCAERIKKKARLCKHCGSAVEPLPEPVPPKPKAPPSMGNDALDARAQLAAEAKNSAGE